MTRRGDLRLWVGLLLLVGSMFAGAHVMSQGAQTVTVWQAGRDMSAGSIAQHVRPITVALGSVADDYVPVSERPVGQLRYPVTEGELIPRSALVAPGDDATRIVTVGVDPLHAPVELTSGDRVDVWSTPDEHSQLQTSIEVSTPSDTLPALVLENVLVEAVSTDSMARELAVVLRVAPDEVATIVHASRAGLIDLVAVPVHSQAVAS